MPVKSASLHAGPAQDSSAIYASFNTYVPATRHIQAMETNK